MGHEAEIALLTLASVLTFVLGYATGLRRGYGYGIELANNAAARAAGIIKE